MSSYSWDISKQSFYSYWWSDISVVCCHFCISAYVQIALIWGFPVQLSLWKSVYWLWRYKLNEVCNTHLLYQYPLPCFLFKDMDLFIEPLRNQFLSLFLRFCYFLLFVSNITFFCHLLYFYCSLFLSFLYFLPSSSIPSFLTFSLLLLFYLLPFVSATLTFPASVFTVFHISLDTSLSLLLLFSS